MRHFSGRRPVIAGLSPQNSSRSSPVRVMRGIVRKPILGSKGPNRSKTMRILIRIAMAAVMVAAFAGRADARQISINGTHGREEIKSTCAKNGGNYYSNLDGYGCVTKNCDGQGNICAVNCQNGGKCTGSVPKIEGLPTPGNIDGILKQKTR